MCDPFGELSQNFQFPTVYFSSMDSPLSLYHDPYSIDSNKALGVLKALNVSCKTLSLEECKEKVDNSVYGEAPILFVENEKENKIIEQFWNIILYFDRQLWNENLQF